MSCVKTCSSTATTSRHPSTRTWKARLAAQQPPQALVSPVAPHQPPRPPPLSALLGQLLERPESVGGVGAAAVRGVFGGFEVCD